MSHSSSFVVVLVVVVFFFFLFMIPSAAPLSFCFNFSDESADNSPPDSIAFQGDAFFDRSIHLTRDALDPAAPSSGRAVFRRPVPLYRPRSRSRSRRLADFSTRFSFRVRPADPRRGFGDGLAFFLSPFPSLLPNHSSGGFLGLFDADADADADADPASRLVAVEFDTYQNDWDPSSDHVGVDVGSIRSAATLTWGSSMKDGRVAHARIAYDGAAQNLTVFLAYDDSPASDGAACSLSFAVDLRQHLPDRVAVGFSAATGGAVELHQILYWEFSSTLDPDTAVDIEFAVAIAAASVLALISIIGLLLFVLRRRKNAQRRKEAEEEDDDDDGGDNMAYDELAGELEIGSGPRRFRYAELAAATDNFAEERKLGEGGFGTVYRGFLRSSQQDVAVKRVAKGSSQGRKEYVAEVKIISRLRHRNLVRLVGWCHDRDADFLLVYEFVPNGSLDLRLYSTELLLLLPWRARYKIAVGLASAILYLHEECEQCVVHGDIKPSNVMLDSAFNAKLGDFGLARLVDHDDDSAGGAQTTVVAGTVGYLAPECVTTGKASKESDVYSFGVVALEIACGRRPVDPTEEEPGRARLLPWAWEMHGRKAIQEAADVRLNKAFDGAELERLAAVGLWCAHPDWTLRPSMRQALAVLKFKSPPPVLPPKMPVPVYFAPPIADHVLSGAASSFADAGDGGFRTSSSSSDRLLEP